MTLHGGMQSQIKRNGNWYANSRREGGIQLLLMEHNMILLASASTAVHSRYSSIFHAFGPFVTAGEYRSVLASLEAVRPEILVLDLDLPGLSADSCVADLRTLMPTMKIVVMAPTLATETELHSILSGARACCSYDIEPLVFRRLIVTIRDGELWYRRSLMPLLMDAILESSFAQEEVQYDEAANFPDLTERECEIAVLVAKGNANKVIARQLQITERTVKFHLTGIFRKLGITGRLALVTRLAAELESTQPSAGCVPFVNGLDFIESETPDKAFNITGLDSRRHWLQQLAGAFDYLPSRAAEPGTGSDFKHDNKSVDPIWH